MMKLEGRLIHLFYQKDEAAVNRVYVLTSRLLRHLAYDVLKDSDLAQDAVMEAYVNVLYSDNRPSDSKAFVSYLCSATKNSALSILRKLGREIEFDEDSVGANEAKEDNALMETLRKELGYPDFDILILHAVEGYSLKEIATYLDLGSPSAVRGRYARAKEKAKALIKKEGF